MANGVLVVEHDDRRQDDLGLARDRPDGAVPRDRTIGRFDLTISKIGGIPSYVAVDPQLAKGQVLPARCRTIVRLLRVDLRPVPVQRRRRDRRQREERRLLARDADEAGVRPDARRGDARARALAHVVRRRGHADAVAGHLAARGLRDVVGVDLERAHRATRRPQQYFENLYNTPAAGRRFWTPPPGDPGTPAFLFNGTIYYRGGMTLAGAAREDRRLRRSSPAARLGRAEPVRQRDDAAVHRARRAGQRDGPRALLRRLALRAGEADFLVATRPLLAVRRRGGPRAGPPRRRARGRAGSACSARAPRARSA